MIIRSALKFIKILVRRNRLIDKLYLYLRYGSHHPFTAKYWDKIWQDEGLETWRTYPDKFDFIISLISPGSRVLDMGCGVGILLNRLKTEKECDVFGVDISLKAVEIARQSGIPCKVCKLPQLSLDSDCFDVVIATEVIEHLHDPKEAIKQMCRVLHAGGTMILSTPNVMYLEDTL
jgi:2-polyprenyl-3-methyl-5-hydroxy-6-metoxy-1,4-benzoquinol methylase